MKTIIATSVAALLLVNLSGCVIKIGGSSTDANGDMSSLLGGIDVAEHRHTGDISTVNGGVDIGDHAAVGDVSVVNGGVDIGNYVDIRSIDVVNGNIEAGNHVTISHSVETVNGNVVFQEQANIGNDVETVNGDIEFTHGMISGDIETVNGDISLTGRTHVVGDITYDKKSDNWDDDDHIPTLHLDPEVNLEGKIILYREVNLDFDQAQFSHKVEYRYTNA